MSTPMIEIAGRLYDPREITPMERFHLLCEYLKENTTPGRRFHRDELMQRFGIETPRTFYRYMEKVRTMGVPIERGNDQYYYSITLDD